MRNSRIIFYSHDTFGLGHIRRTQKLANQIAGPDRSILILCSSPKASAFESAPGIGYLNLPGFVKLPNGEYAPRNTGLPIGDFVEMRSQIILAAVRSLKPNVLVIDKEPLGVKRELLATLDYLRKERPECQIICGFRDILDEREAVEKEWASRDTVEALDRYFDHIFIYGEKKYFDFAREYSLPSRVQSKLKYMGYVVPVKTDAKPVAPLFRSGKPMVTFTLGGGEDGSHILALVLDALERSEQAEFDSFVLTGPFASPSLIRRAQALSKVKPGIQTTSFTDNTMGVFLQSDLVVSMGGYNTMTELMSIPKNLLVIPRVTPRKEQWMRASIFRDHGFCDLLDPKNFNVESLLAGIKRSLLRESTGRQSLVATGLERFGAFFDEGLKA